ncbi:heparin lyase I family protein [Paraburkholderia fungorum]|jgi:hypothetical protein|uniref:Polysaccharide lyase n=1 Tax=Paraburkholderia fungorum TaxID=134537 RepID=A0AAW3US15_9BURK|nr:heparin lyase I family protein [Paraburkholderia fungorum]MBB4511985.1 hypothetical protein [Paraburkholderia fungorum]MBB6199891.1 hypothetical protein [Paraburkholderia fungorum]
MKNRKTSLTLVFLALAIGGSWSFAADDTYAVMYRSAWREGIDPRLTIQAPKPDAISVGTIPQFGEEALRVSMHRSDDFSTTEGHVPRAEIVFAPVARFGNGHEYELRWSTMIPMDYLLDSQQPEIITQVHQSSHFGSPPVSLILVDGRYRVEVRTEPGKPIHSYTFGAPADDRGRVVKWMLQYRPDDTGAQALTNVYKDGMRVVHSVGEPNAFPGERNAYFKIGIYKWWWNSRSSDVNDRTMYYGNVEIAERVRGR